MISDNHLAFLARSTITPGHAEARGYQTIRDPRRLDELGIAKAGQRTQGLLVPQLRKDGSTWGYQYRADHPRETSGKLVKYETPVGQRNGIDVPPGVNGQLGNPTVPLWITEGVKKADAGALAGLCIVALPGVWCWRGKNKYGGRCAVPDWNDIALNDGRRVILAFDGDVARKPQARQALTELASYVAGKGAHVEYLHLPDTDTKTGLDDYLAAGHTVEDLWRLVKPTPPPVTQTCDIVQQPPDPEPQPATPMPLDDALNVFGKWLHLNNDTAPVIVTAATAVANLVTGDPVWMLLVGPPSGGKTEILSSLMGLPYIVPAATITEAALLSGTATHERTKDATGGLLRQIGEFGILLTKDFTSVLSQNTDVAKKAVAALREIYDGRWDRPVGVDGAKVLHWHGKCGFIGGVTPSYDRYSMIVNTLGDRYMLLRLPTADPDKQARAALAQAEHETQMRAELAQAMTGLIASADQAKVHAPLDDTDTGALVDLAIYAARARTGVDRNYHTGELEVIPQPEGPARLVKAMRQLYGGMLALGVDDETRWAILTRIAIDCTPRIRRPLIEALLKHPTDEGQRTAKIADAVGMTTKVVAVHLDNLALIGLAEWHKESEAANSPYRWTASEWLRENWPPERTKVRRKNTTTHIGTFNVPVPSTPTPQEGGGSFASHFDADASPNGQVATGGPGPGPGPGEDYVLCSVCGWVETHHDTGVCAECRADDGDTCDRCQPVIDGPQQRLTHRCLECGRDPDTKGHAPNCPSAKYKRLPNGA
jgi:hypothetical protein